MANVQFFPPTNKNHQKHRVLIYLTCYNVLDGVTLTIRKIENEILERGHSVCILTTTSGNMSNTHIHMEEGAGAQSQQYQRYRHLPNKHPNRKVLFLDENETYPIPFTHDPKNPDSSYYMGFSLSEDVKKQLDEYKPTIFHMTVPDLTSLYLIDYARARQIPIMATYHSNIPDYFAHYPGLGCLKYVVAAFVRHQYNFVQALYVPTPFIRRHLSLVDDCYRFDKVTSLNVWGRGVDLERFHPSHRSDTFRARYGFSPDDVVVTWVGRLVPEKRPDIFAYVVRKLAEEGTSFKALVIGAGPNEDHMKSLNLPRTTFTGWLSGDELAIAFASSDVFLFPSAVETFGNVTLEAAASGLPLVVNSGCSGHLVQHSVNGYACNDGDMEAYYDATRCLVLNATRRKSMSKESRNLSLRFENKTVCGRMIENYTTITEEFYAAYNGDHANRDREYEMEDESFAYGCYVLPSCYLLVVHLVINVIIFVCKIDELILKVSTFRKSWTGHSTTPVINVMSSNDSSSASHPLTTSRDFTVDAIDTSGDMTTQSIRKNEFMLNSPYALKIISEVEESLNDCESTESYQETMDSEAVKPSLIIMSATTSDDDTDSTGSSLLGCDLSSAPSSGSLCDDSSHERRVNRLWRCDLPASHNIMISLIKIVCFQAQIECSIRKFCSRDIPVSRSKKLSGTSNRTTRKRKDSEEISPDDFSDMLSIKLKESLLPLNADC